MKAIYIVEDTTAIRKLFTTILKKNNFDVYDASDGEGLLSSLVNAKPDLIIMDILLPDINGTELINKVRQIPACSTVPIIAVTGFATEQDEIAFKKLGFDGYMSKPINTTEFLNLVNALLK